VARARATSAPRARGSPAAPRLATPPLRAAGAPARAEGAEGEDLASPPLRDGGSRPGRMPAAMAPQRTGLTAELGCGRARAGGARALRGRRGGQDRARMSVTRLTVSLTEHNASVK